ncbi:ATP-binding cassette domain-containing protein [bacterium]|nr:ATP-binding cassette domain-containing protein [bacterium]
MPVPRPAPVLDAAGSAVRFDAVVKRFDRHVAVDGLDLTVPRGAVYGLLGPNGAGKTTSIRMLMGILGVDEGRILVMGDEPSGATKDRIGYLPEERGLYPQMKVMDNLLYFGGLHGLRADDARRAAVTWLERLSIRDAAPRRLQELSKGNQQKVQFVATVMHAPDLLVLDEPFSGLDPVNQDLMRSTILDLAANGTTIVLSTHLMDEVERLCSHLTLIHAGRAITEGSLAAVKHAHGDDTVHLEVDGDASFVTGLPGVASVRRVGRRLEVTLAEGAEAPALLAAVVARAPVRHFEVRAASLHSIFVKMVSPGAESAPAGAAPPAAREAVKEARS